MGIRRTLSEVQDRPELDKLLQEAIVRFNKLPLAQQKDQRLAQRKSWVIGEMLLEHPEMTREEIERIYQSVCAL